MRFRSIARALSFAFLALAAQGHVGSPDVYLDGKAGPYQLFVTIRTPDVIPGVAELQVRSQSSGVREIQVVPIPITGQATKFAPVPDQLTRSPQDPQFFTGSLWIMAAGSWQVRITVNGAQGSGVLAVPLPAAALVTKPMQRGLGILLSVLMLFLIGGLVAIVGANTREAKLDPGIVPDARRKRQARLAMSIAFAVIIAIVWFGDRWWTAVESGYRSNLYKPLGISASLDTAGVLTLALRDPGTSESKAFWGEKFFPRGIDDLVPDHNHLMHLYAIRQPALDAVYHLHPDRTAPGTFRLRLPAMPAGTYRLYADIVHTNGFPETLVATVQIPALSGRPLSGDDASGVATPWQSATTPTSVFALPDGYRMQWIDASSVPRIHEARYFRFRLIDAQGQPARDVALYMGMPGHAAFVKTDGTVFAHVHPTGSVSMAAFLLAQHGSAASMDMPGMDMPSTSSLPADVAFPYGFPTPGRYRIFVQMKHGETIENGVFDTQVR
jgi:hypothetical protein